MFFKRKKQVDIDWESIISTLPIPVCWKDKQGRYLGCNLLHAESLGCTAVEDLIDKTDDDLPTVRKFTIEGQYHIQRTLVNFNGSEVGTVIFTFDVSKYRGQLEQSWQRLDEIIAVMPGYVYWKDRQCILQGCNAQLAKSAGLPDRQSIIGKTSYDLLVNRSNSDTQQQAAIANSYDEEVMKNNQTMTVEETITMPDHSIATFLSKKTPLHDQFGNVTGVVGISFDITDRKKSREELKKAKEEAEAANHAKTEFLKNMRHDIRTPLSGIVGFARMIQQEACDTKIQHYAEQLVASTIALLDFQNDILDAVKVSTGTMPVLYTRFDLSALAKKVIDLSKPKAVLKKLSCQLELDNALPHHVRGDPRRLFRVLLELMTNAIKFTDTGAVKLHLQVQEKNQKTMVLSCKISDTGIGISEEKQPYIFQRFYRASPSHEGKYEGTGLGLSIVKTFISELSGSITVESALGKGSVFRCLLPLAIADQHSKKTTTQEIPSVIHLPIEKIPVLLVEDHCMTAMVTEALFNEIGCHVTICHNAKSALQHIHQTSFQIAFVDVGLPDMNGIALAKKIKLLQPSLPIIALTAHIETDQLQHAQLAAMSDIIQKPLLKADALKLIHTYVLEKRMQKPRVDLHLGAQRLQKDYAAAKEMLGLLLSNIDIEIHHFQAALKQGNYDGLKKLTHKLLGGLAYCGAPRLEESCKKLQSELETKNNKVITQAVHALLAEINELKKSYGEIHVV